MHTILHRICPTSFISYRDDQWLEKAKVLSQGC